MAVTRGNSVENTWSTGQTSRNVSHTVATDTDLLLVFIALEGTESISGTPTWNTSEDLILIEATDGGIDNMDVNVWSYGVLTPTATTANISFSFTSSNPGCIVAADYKGVATTSMAAATNLIDEDQNLGNASSTVMVSGGGANNALVGFGVAHHSNMNPASQSDGFTEIFDGTTGGGGAGQDFSYALYELLSGLPSGLTINWTNSNENAGQLIELVASGAPPAELSAQGLILQ